VIPFTFGLVLLALLAFWLVKRRRTRRVTLISEEHVRVESLERDGVMEALRRGLGKLGELAGLVGQFGLGKKFYAAISVRHIYANLQKLATRRGYPRDPAWTPNDYLPHLRKAFPGQDEALLRITAAYNAFEYGHVSTDAGEMEELREAWLRISSSNESV